MRAVLKKDRPFSFAVMVCAGSSLCVKHSRFRIFLFVLLGISALFAGASFILPYDWKPDPAARFKVAAVLVKRDRTDYWVTIHLKKNGEMVHDLTKPVRLITSQGQELELADTTLSGEDLTGIVEIWFKFWVNEAEMSGPLELKMNDGVLKIKSTDGVPPIVNGMMRTFKSPRW